MRAVRRALVVVHGVEVEILEGVESIGSTGDMVVATPDLDRVDRIIVSGRQIPVLPLSTMQALLDATGNRERAAMVAKVLGGRSSQAECRLWPIVMHDAFEASPPRRRDRSTWAS